MIRSGRCADTKLRMQERLQPRSRNTECNRGPRFIKGFDYSDPFDRREPASPEFGKLTLEPGHGRVVEQGTLEVFVAGNRLIR